MAQPQEVENFSAAIRQSQRPGIDEPIRVANAALGFQFHTPLPWYPAASSQLP
jgi:hypothetical protein